MKIHAIVPLQCQAIGLAFALTLGVPLFSAPETASGVQSDTPSRTPRVFNKDEARAALAQVDAELNHLDQLANAAPTAAAKAELTAGVSAMRERKDELKENFDQPRYEALKKVLQLQKGKVSAWSRENPDREKGQKNATPNPAVPAHTGEKGDLTRLDADLYLLEARIDTLTDPARKAESKRGLKQLKDRRNELNREFRRDRYDALVNEVKSQWDTVIDKH